MDVGTSATYERSVYRITSESALQSGGSFSWSYDPTYETFTLHHLRVIRDGVVQERLREDAVQIIQQERDLDRHMLNGRLTALILLDDVRTGDVVDCAFSRRGANPVFDGRYMDGFGTGWSVPVRHQRIRVRAPAGREIRHKHHGGSPLGFSSSALDGHTVLTWEGRGLPVISTEDELPSWFTPYPFLQLTEFADWASVARWAVPLYEIPAPIPGEISAQAAALTNGFSRDEDKIAAILQFVQQEIRYLGLELGPGTHRPTAPGDVLARRFGDCKDKTLLFCTLMRAAGFEAWPALVHTSYRDRIAGWMSTPYAFDHVIACVALGEFRWWVDPTLTHQRGGPLHRGLPDYRIALPVRPDADALVPVVRPAGALRSVVIDERFDIPDFKQPASFTITTRYSGLSADSVRSYFARTPSAQVIKDYLNYYTSSYAGISSAGPVEWTDNPAANTVTAVERYNVPGLWSENGTVLKAEFYPKSIADYTDLPSTRVRTMPLRAAHPVSVRLTTSVHLPEDWNVTPADNTVEDHAFRASDKITGSGRLVTMAYSWESLSDHIPADKVPAHIAALERVRGSLGYSLTYDRAVSTGAGEDPAAFRFNWMPVVFILVAVGVVFYAGRRLLALPPPAPPAIPGPGELRLVGIGGWLALVAFGVVLRPIVTTAQVIKEFGYTFNLASWEAITLPGGTGYQPVLGPLIIAELVVNTLLIAGGVLLAILLFRRKRAFPALFIVLMLGSLAFTAVDNWLVARLFSEDIQAAHAGFVEVGRIGIQCAIWVPYMLLSRRVKLTFTR